MTLRHTINGTAFIIETDHNQFMLYELKMNTKPDSKNFGNPTKSFVGYFPKLEWLIERLITVAADSSKEVMTLEAFIQSLREYKKEVELLIEGVK